MEQSSEDTKSAANRVKTVTLQVLRKSEENQEPHKQRQLQVATLLYCVAQSLLPLTSSFRLTASEG